MFIYGSSLREASRNVFRSIPDDVILDMATREFNMWNPNSCVCGWAMRAGLDKLTDAGFGPVARNIESRNMLWCGSPQSDKACCEMFNGATRAEWFEVYNGVTYDLPIVEEAFVERLNEAVENS